jgi:hypothetical protein
MDDDGILSLVINDAIADDSSAGYLERVFKVERLDDKPKFAPYSEVVNEVLLAFKHEIRLVTSNLAP